MYYIEMMNLTEISMWAKVRNTHLPAFQGVNLISYAMAAE